MGTTGPRKPRGFLAVTMKELLECGVHFGHQTRRWNPKMAEYIFAERNGIYIIDLQKTLRMLETAARFVEDIAAKGVESYSSERNANPKKPYAARQFDAGCITSIIGGSVHANEFQTIRRSVNRLDKLDADEANGTFGSKTQKGGHAPPT